VFRGTYHLYLQGCLSIIEVQCDFAVCFMESNFMLLFFVKLNMEPTTMVCHSSSTQTPGK
jgi:hypothetical protein